MNLKRRRKRIEKTRHNPSTARRPSPAIGQKADSALPGRELVNAALDSVEAIVGKQFRDRLTLPTWMIVDSSGSEIARNVFMLDGPTSDAEVTEALSQRTADDRAAAVAVAVVRVDDSDLRILAWDLAGATRSVSRPVIERGRLSGWRRGWLDQFDSTPRGEEGATLVHIHHDQTTLEEAASELESLADQTLEFFITRVLSQASAWEDVTGITGRYDERGQVVIGRAREDRIVDQADLGSILNHLREETALGHESSVVHVLRLAERQQAGSDQHQFVVAGFDQRYDSVFASVIAVDEEASGLRFEGLEAIPAAQRDQMLRTAEQASENPTGE